MNAQEFISTLKIVVVNRSKESVISILNKPPGRKPSKKLIEISDWYNKLEHDDKDMVAKIINESIKMSVFGFLCMLDGVTAIEDTYEKGKLLLYYQKDDKRQLINDPDSEYLHDLFNEE